MPERLFSNSYILLQVLRLLLSEVLPLDANYREQ